ncbi:MAG: DUF1080 domain-containing protein [Planctomycetaceae bacterium]
MRILLALLLCASSTNLFAADDDGFVQLFDGTTLNGWHGNAEYWSVQDGAIFGKTDGNIPANTFLISTNEYKNFVLRVKWKLHGHKGNSGVQFRSVEVNADAKSPPYVVGGYQADIADNHYLGILYGERTGRGIIQNLDADLQAKVAAAVNQDGWNEYVITANGDHITQVLNGVVTVDIEDPEGAKSGIIALQLHRGQDMSISFQEIAIKVLP